MNLIKRYFLKKDFFIFLVIGGINTLNGVVFSFVYSLFLQVNVAFVFGYISALSVAYFLNSFFVFHNRIELTKLIKFIISYIPNFIIQNVLVLFLYNGLHWNKLLVYALAAIVGMPITFLVLKLFAFRKE